MKWVNNKINGSYFEFINEDNDSLFNKLRGTTNDDQFTVDLFVTQNNLALSALLKKFNLSSIAFKNFMSNEIDHFELTFLSAKDLKNSLLIFQSENIMNDATRINILKAFKLPLSQINSLPKTCRADIAIENDSCAPGFNL